MSNFLNIDNAKSYATEANLVKALEACHLENAMPVIVRNRAGRFTAVFSGSHLSVMGIGIATAAHHGFKTL